VRGRFSMKTKLWRSASLLALATSAAAGAAETVTYRYDALGRLVSTSVSGGPASGVGSIYDYDSAGNRTRVRVGGVTTPTPTPPETPTPTPPPSTPTPTPPATPTPTVSPGTVTNFSFEQPALGSNFQYKPSVANMTFSDGTGVAGNGSAFAYPNAPDGTQLGFLQGASDGNGIIRQTVTGLTSGASYTVSFRGISRPGYPGGGVNVAIEGSGQIGEFAATTSFTSYTSRSFTATGTSATIVFTAQPNGGYTATGIDQVVVAQAPTGGNGAVASPSFESPTVSSHAYGSSLSLTGVTFGSGAGIAANGGAFAFPSTSDGNQAGFLQVSAGGTNSTIEEQVSGLTPGASYRVVFRTVYRPGYAQGRLQVLVGTATLSDLTAPTSWTSYTSSSFTATASTMTVTFRGLAQSDNATAIDAIQVVRQ